MGEEREIEPKEILRRTRIETLPYIRKLTRHRRAILPRLEISKRWIEYYEQLSRTRPLTKRERARLEAHRKAYELYQRRLELLRAAARYARRKTPTELLALRRAQARYYEAKAELLPPERAREVREKLVPPKELYEELERIRQEIAEKCKSYKAVKYRTTPSAALMSPVTRMITLQRLGEELRERYAKAYELSQKGMSMSELIEHYKEMKEAGLEI